MRSSKCEMRNAECGMRSLAATQQHDRRLRRGEKLLLQFRKFAVPADLLQRRSHQGERFLLAMLRRAQMADAWLEMRCDHQVKSAETFHCNNPPVAKGVRRRENRIAGK